MGGRSHESFQASVDILASRPTGPATNVSCDLPQAAVTASGTQRALQILHCYSLDLPRAAALHFLAPGRKALLAQVNEIFAAPKPR